MRNENSHKSWLSAHLIRNCLDFSDLWGKVLPFEPKILVSPWKWAILDSLDSMLAWRYHYHFISRKSNLILWAFTSEVDSSPETHFEGMNLSWHDEIIFSPILVITVKVLHIISSQICSPLISRFIFLMLWLVGAEEGEKACSYAEFRCENGPCIPRRKRCDGRIDCPLDPSDELDCCKLQNLEERKITTYYHHTVLLTVVV
jgi:hypothetical protein